MDLVGYRVERYLGEVLINERQYESLEELTETELEALDFSELVSVTDEELEHYHNKADERPALLPLDAATEYNALKEQHPDALVGFEQNGQFEFYGEDARKVCELLGGKFLEKETALGTVPVISFPRNQWAYRAKQLWQRGENVYLAGLNEDGTHHQTKYLRREDYLPLGATVHMEGRAFRVDTVNFDKGSVTLQDVALAEMRMPIFREEPLALVRELYEQEQEVMEHTLPAYKVGDNVIVDLPSRTIEGKIGYVGETDVRIDTSAQGQSWDNEVINKQQFEDGLRQVEPELSDEELDALPISTVMDGKVQTFPDAAALDEALNTEPAPEPAGNFRITDDHLGEGGAKQKYARNIEAIRTLFKLEEEHRGATAEEQQVLSQYVGWGGLADAFDPNKENWSAEYTQLKELLSEDEYAAARASTLNAHYTGPTVIRGIYDAVERMGFQSGNILEPSMGVGNFFGMLPTSMADSRLYGVELDSITGRIAKKLYPQADITVAGFETTDRRDFYDLAVGNVPFGQYKVNDKAYNKLGFSIHNYFFAKAIDQIRPGGVIAFVTSRYTMDSKDSTARKHMAERADLLGAIRLPNNAFRANAGTDVVSDIIFLQKRDRPADIEPAWVQLGKTEDGFAINQYFADRPEMVLGVLSTESTQYGREELTVAPIEGANLANQLAEAVQHIEGQYTAAEVDAPDIAEEETTRRKNYQKMRTRFISSVEKRLRKYVKDGQAFKSWLRDEAESYYKALKEYGELKRDEQLGFTVNNDTFRIQVKGNRVKRFDERADIAEKRLIDYLSKWIKQRGDGERNPIYKLAMSLLQRNEYGDLDYKSISRLYELEEDFNDTEYTEIMQLFRESNTVEGNVIRFYFEEKDELNKWKRIEPSFNQI